MKMSNLFIAIMSAIIICFSSMLCITASAATVDEAVIAQNDDKYVPLYTKSPDSSLKDHSSLQFTDKDYQLFYTQTTLLALVAGYLILFKVKGLKNSEKMHRRKK